MNIELLKALCETPGVPGNEERVRELIIGEVEGLFDEVRVDAMGFASLCSEGQRERPGADHASLSYGRDRLPGQSYFRERVLVPSAGWRFRSQEPVFASRAGVHQ